MKARLMILEHDSERDYSGARHLRFVVVDLDRAKEYPVNFVCMLPIRFGSTDSKSTIFERVFGNNGLIVAKNLLTKTLESETDDGVKTEIARRLKLLDPESIKEKNCVGCGKVFQVDPKQKFRKRFCEDCVKRKFGGRH